jgi:intergrase/recombinase
MRAGYRCVKDFTCEVCGIPGLLQIISKGYARVRHYSHLEPLTKKPKFAYHRQSLEYVKSILDTDGDSDHTGQGCIDLKLLNSGVITEKGSASIAQRLERQPCKTNIDWKEYKDFLTKRYTHQYANMQYNNAVKYLDCLENPSGLLTLSVWSRANVMKALICLSKYQGKYLEFKNRLKQYDIRWKRPDSFSSFMNMINNDHKDLAEWYTKVYEILANNEKLYLRFMLLSGLRVTEGVQSFNLIIALHKQNKLDEYFNEDLNILEHFRFKQFLRNTKNAFISIVPKDLVMEIAQNKPVSYYAIHKFLERRRIRLGFKELRSYYATYLAKHGIISEIVDLLQGRISKSVFARHYLKENPQTLSCQVLPILKDLENSIQQN